MEETKEIYWTQQWKKARKECWRRAGGLCERCESKGKQQIGEIVHHIIQITPTNKNNPAIVLDQKNLMLVCRECHGQLHRQKMRYSIKGNGEVTIYDE